MFGSAGLFLQVKHVIVVALKESKSVAYDITRVDVLDASATIVRAGETLGIATADINACNRAQLRNRGTDRSVVAEALAHRLRLCEHQRRKSQRVWKRLSRIARTAVDDRTE